MIRMSVDIITSGIIAGGVLHRMALWILVKTNTYMQMMLWRRNARVELARCGIGSELCASARVRV